MVTILMMSTKMATLGLFKIKELLVKGIISLHDVTNKILLRGSNYIIHVAM